MRTELPAWVVTGLTVVGIVAITIAGKKVPTELYLLGGGAVGVAGGVSLPFNSKKNPPNA